VDDDRTLNERFYVEMRAVAGRLFAHERTDHTLQPTAAVHEAWVRMMTNSPLPDVPPDERLALGARVLRQVLVDHSRKHAAAKRGGQAVRIELDPELISPTETIIEFDAIHGALERLRELHERQAEVVSLRIFGGLTMEQVAAVIGVSKRTVEGDWTVARAWLKRELSK
jgi:RNA polymerase sigma factor (TIGR02999 family)